MTSLFANSIFSPAAIFILGALLVPLLKGRLKSAVLLLIPVVVLGILIIIPEGKMWIARILDYELVLGRVDRLSRVFGIIFTLISFIAILFALRERDDLQYSAGLVYAGSALGVTFAGDFFSLYIFWELMAVASTFLILARRTRTAQAAAFRYILVHVCGGLFLLAGIVIYYRDAGTLTFTQLSLEGAASWLIFLGIAVNAAIPPLHAWLKDAYPEATPVGAVFLCAFTTKSAVYVMARIFPGTELLIWLGCIMTAIPLFYMVLENDIRRILAYSLINQVGFMMVGIGIGSPLALNGAVSHAFSHILYKSLLFMAAGAVIHQTGRMRCTDLGGLYKTMPWTCVCCIIGAAGMSVPLFCGFVTKSMIISAAAHHKLAVVWLMLEFASAAVFTYAGIKIPYFTFFSEDSGVRTSDPPYNMRLAMGIAAFFCIAVGVFPGLLYRLLPYADTHYIPYTAAHVVGQIQLLMFGALAFCILILSGLYPSEVRAINLDTDWFYRKGGRYFFRLMDTGFNALNRICDDNIAKKFSAAVGRAARRLPVETAIFFLTLPRRFGRKRKGIAVTRQKIEAAFAVGAIPTGVGAVAAALFVVLIFIFT